MRAAADLLAASTPAGPDADPLLEARCGPDAGSQPPLPPFLRVPRGGWPLGTRPRGLRCALAGTAAAAPLPVSDADEVPTAAWRCPWLSEEGMAWAAAALRELEGAAERHCEGGSAAPRSGDPAVLSDAAAAASLSRIGAALPKALVAVAARAYEVQWPLNAGSLPLVLPALASCLPASDLGGGGSVLAVRVAELARRHLHVVHPPAQVAGAAAMHLLASRLPPDAARPALGGILHALLHAVESASDVAVLAAAYPALVTVAVAAQAVAGGETQGAAERGGDPADATAAPLVPADALPAPPELQASGTASAAPTAWSEMRQVTTRRLQGAGDRRTTRTGGGEGPAPPLPPQPLLHTTVRLLGKARLASTQPVAVQALMATGLRLCAATCRGPEAAARLPELVEAAAAFAEAYARVECPRDPAGTRRKGGTWSPTPSDLCCVQHWSRFAQAVEGALLAHTLVLRFPREVAPRSGQGAGLAAAVLRGALGSRASASLDLGPAYALGADVGADPRARAVLDTAWQRTRFTTAEEEGEEAVTGAEWWLRHQLSVEDAAVGGRLPHAASAECLRAMARTDERSVLAVLAAVAAAAGPDMEDAAEACAELATVVRGGGSDAAGAVAGAQ